MSWGDGAEVKEQNSHIMMTSLTFYQCFLVFPWAGWSFRSKKIRKDETPF